MKNSKTTKTDNFGNLNLMDMFFTRIAKEQFVTHRFSKEYRTVLVLVFLFDILAVFASIFAGYFYLYVLVIKTLNNILVAKILTITALIILEILVHIGLAKFFKFFIKSNIAVAFVALVLVTLLWSVSFQLSTKGLSMRQSKKVSKVESISSNFELEKQNLLNSRNAQITDIKELQKDIKSNPTRWKNGKLSLLSSQQLTDIKEYQKEISEIKQQYRTDILSLQKTTDKEYKQDEFNTQNEANEYYNLITIVMFIELLASGFLMFSWSMVLKENKSEDYINSNVNDFKSEVDTRVFALFKDSLHTQFRSFQLAIETNENNSIPFEFENTKGKKENSNISDAEIINKKNVGFQMQQTTNEPTKPSNPKAKVCAYCGADISHKKHWNAKYCDRTCQRKAWELKTDRKLIYKKKK